MKRTSREAPLRIIQESVRNTRGDIPFPKITYFIRACLTKLAITTSTPPISLSVKCFHRFPRVEQFALYPASGIFFEQCIPLPARRAFLKFQHDLSTEGHCEQAQLTILWGTGLANEEYLLNTVSGGHEAVESAFRI